MDINNLNTICNLNIDDTTQINCLNKKRKIFKCVDIFVLNINNQLDYKYVNPYELIIVNASNNYSDDFLKLLINGGIKTNVKKIITSDSVIVKYIKKISNIFVVMFPNCKTIQINALENDYMLISRIIDDLEIIKNVEYKLNDYICLSKSLSKYKYFYDYFFIGSLSNIKYVKIFNDIPDNNIECFVEKKIITEIINQKMIKKNNNSLLLNIKKYNVKTSDINYIYLQYIDIKRNIEFDTYIVNIKDIDFVDDTSNIDFIDDISDM